MKSNVMNLKGKAGGRTISTQQAVFEMKQRLLLSLNKLADRDTHQIAVEEIQKTAVSLSPDMIAPFLSCITDTDSEQKITVRKECLKLMGTIARSHGSLLAPHLAKMTGSIVKRLKDSDSVVRDACVETCGVLVTSIRNYGGEGGGGSIFLAVVRPLFEALGEQNRYVQAGAALCLAKVIDESSDSPTSFLSQMLTRVVKLLKNPHFMAKPAVIELIRSIVQAGCASTEHALSAALTSILDALKSSDWSTRKAASVALASISLGGGYLLGSFKASCIRSLERCRFDKVKPVRDAILHAIQCWKALPGTGSPEPSEAGSSLIDNLGEDNHDIRSVSDSGWRGTSIRKVTSVSAQSGNSISSIKKRAPLSVRKSSTYNMPNEKQVKSNDWHIQISLPKTRIADTEDKVSGSSCISMDVEIREDANVRQESKYEYDPTLVKYEYEPTDEKLECPSVSDLTSRSYEIKHVSRSAVCESTDNCDQANLIGTKHVMESASCGLAGDWDPVTGISGRLVPEEIEPGCLRSQGSKSLESTITDLGSQGMHGCCVHAANELSSIKKQLQGIETKQAYLLDLLQVFMENSMDNMSTLQLKVHNLEDAADKVFQDATQSEHCSSMASSKVLKNQSVNSSPRLPMYSPTPSVDADCKRPLLLSMKNRNQWEDNSSCKSRLSTSIKEGIERQRVPTRNITRNSTAKGIENNSERIPHSLGNGHARDSRWRLSDSASNDSAKIINLETTIVFTEKVRQLLDIGDLDSAYMEAFCSGDDLSIIKLMDRTGPVLERLSPEIANEVLGVLVTSFLDQRSPDSIIPWLQQVLDLSTSHEPQHLFLSIRAQMEFLSALNHVTSKGRIDPVYRKSISQLAAKISQACSEISYRKILPIRVSRERKNEITTAIGCQ
ncbi:TORTIFOLIA1-like protein 2 [Typha latifolia]|uniref:TORTIFOLIA1-like protein 2 n=1 Tax=Typha latifolia TaxID=4733 RepID=UPI003C2DDCE4